MQQYKHFHLQKHQTDVKRLNAGYEVTQVARQPGTEFTLPLSNLALLHSEAPTMWHNDG